MNPRWKSTSIQEMIAMDEESLTNRLSSALRLSHARAQGHTQHTYTHPKKPTNASPSLTATDATVNSDNDITNTIDGRDMNGKEIHDSTVTTTTKNNDNIYNKGIMYDSNGNSSSNSSSHNESKSAIYIDYKDGNGSVPADGIVDKHAHEQSSTNDRIIHLSSQVCINSLSSMCMYVYTRVPRYAFICM